MPRAPPSMSQASFSRLSRTRRFHHLPNGSSSLPSVVLAQRISPPQCGVRLVTSPPALLGLLPAGSPMSGPAFVPRRTPFPDAPSRSTLRLHPWLPGYRHPVVFLFPLNPGQTPRPRSRSPQSGQQPASAADFPGLPLGICPLARPGFPSSTSHTSASPVGPCSRAISFAEP